MEPKTNEEKKILPNTEGKTTLRINKTENNLKLVWEQLDCASGYLYNALDNLGRMVDLPEEILKISERINPSMIDILRNEMELLIEEKTIDEL